jgi:hypothetical protein
MKARRIRSGSRKPVSCATRSIAWLDDCTHGVATSIRSRSTAFDGAVPVSATKARAQHHQLEAHSRPVIAVRSQKPVSVRTGSGVIL